MIKQPKTKFPELVHDGNEEKKNDSFWEKPALSFIGKLREIVLGGGGASQDGNSGQWNAFK